MTILKCPYTCKYIYLCLVCESRKFNPTVTWNCFINKVKMYLPYTPSDKYAYKRKQNITIDEDKHRV